LTKTPTLNEALAAIKHPLSKEAFRRISTPIDKSLFARKLVELYTSLVIKKHSIAIIYAGPGQSSLDQVLFNEISIHFWTD